jgi:Mrp family chromosome partitioning ATPase
MHECRVLAQEQGRLRWLWSGPKKSATIRQFVSDVRWGDLDYLIDDIDDTPPGEHAALIG